MSIVKMGKFTAIGMREKVSDPNALVINTCSDNDTKLKGDYTHWSWCNPTNRGAGQLICGTDPTIMAVSTECMWQGTKILQRGGQPNPLALLGNWRLGKAKKPYGAWNGPGKPLITNPGEARLKIYIPAYSQQILHWLKDEEVHDWVIKADGHPGDVYLRDHDTGRGVMRIGPMSHAWVLAVYLNTGEWPTK